MKKIAALGAPVPRKVFMSLSHGDKNLLFPAVTSNFFSGQEIHFDVETPSLFEHTSLFLVRDLFQQNGFIKLNTPPSL